LISINRFRRFICVIITLLLRSFKSEVAKTTHRPKELRTAIWWTSPVPFSTIIHFRTVSIRVLHHGMLNYFSDASSFRLTCPKVSMWRLVTQRVRTKSSKTHFFAKAFQELLPLGDWIYFRIFHRSNMWFSFEAIHEYSKYSSSVKKSKILNTFVLQALIPAWTHSISLIIKTGKIFGKFF